MSQAIFETSCNCLQFSRWKFWDFNLGPTQWLAKVDMIVYHIKWPFYTGHILLGNDWADFGELWLVRVLSESPSKNDFDICLEKNILDVFFEKYQIFNVFHNHVRFASRCAGPKFKSQNFHRLNWRQLHDVSKMSWSIYLLGPCVVSPKLSFENGQKVAETVESPCLGYIYPKIKEKKMKRHR